ncbi:MAG: hypothetical protein U1G08_20290 [Verrucomicrobiota bacterium]
MNPLRWFRLLVVLVFGWLYASEADTRQVPSALQAWEGWATWNDVHRFCPTPYSDPKTHRCFWPSRLELQVEGAGARFDLGVSVFGSTWMPLPGSTDVWPLAVTANGTAVPVLEHEGGPAVHLEAGQYRLVGSFQWKEIPQRLKIPVEIGVLTLSLDGKPVEAPVWDAQGLLWLKREGVADAGEKNFLSVKLFGALEDGIPMWWHQEVELIVSGKSREEELGPILPEGWRLSSVASPIPMLVDEAGRVKAQVRAGKWTLRLDAFRMDDPKEFRFATGLKPSVADELVAFQARPEFRVVEIVGSPSVDVSQTPVPEMWRSLPVYRWNVAEPFRLEQRMRGMGSQKPAGLSITREWWLDETGQGLTFRDHVNGSMQEIWRLDAAEGEELGSVRIGTQGQLITRNPQNGALGVEIRSRNLNLEATGRMGRPPQFPATGWRSDADALGVTLNLPPGWRLFALFGADWVRGDWLTAWTLLDLFLLLIFTLTVFRLWGWRAAVVAFLAFGLAYHEPGAPRYLWLILLIPLALLRVVPAGGARKVVQLGAVGAATLLVLVLVPFIGRQVQQAIYPQLEVVDAARPFFGQWVAAKSKGMSRRGETLQEESVPVPTDAAPVTVGRVAALDVKLARRYGLSVRPDTSAENLNYDPKARIQTGPAVPDWTWRAVHFGWNGPVQSTQTVRPILIPLSLERVLTVLRVAFLVALGAILFRARGSRPGGSGSGRKAAAAAALMLYGLFGGDPVLAEDRIVPQAPGLPRDASAPSLPAAASPVGFPDGALLDKLRERLLEVSDAYPNAASIPSVSVTLKGRRLTVDAEVHTALRTAVPVPGRLPAWSPVTVTVDGRAEVALRRDDGFLWVVLPEGVHRVRVEGLLAGVGDWECAFLLRPHRMVVEVPGWTVSGLRPDGVPEAQVFFTPEEKSSALQATYERQDLQGVVQVQRELELGLLWQVRTVVHRLSAPGKAIALRLPLIPGENVVSGNVVIRDGMIEVRLGAQESDFSWEGSFSTTNSLVLKSRTNDLWVERWQLVASPVWNVSLSGLAPFFEANAANLVPVWQPWPGETVSLGISRPEAIAGATETVNRALHETNLGQRQRVSKLELSLRCSLAEDFMVGLPPQAEVTSLALDGKTQPVRKEGQKLVVPLGPGDHSVVIGWKTDTQLSVRAEAGAVQLPVGSANIDTVITVPEDRWVLWTSGPQRGPAVRFWVILSCSLMAAVALSRLPVSPLKVMEWVLLAIGLTQVPLPAALVVVGWLFLIAWRRQPGFQNLGSRSFNVLQGVLVLVTAGALGILVFAVGEGLLGSPEMFITGNDSSRTVLRWYLDRSGAVLPEPGCLSVSIWWYRFLMLLWALWLATALIRWLRLGWEHFSAGGFTRSRKPEPSPKLPPPLPQV